MIQTHVINICLAFTIALEVKKAEDFLLTKRITGTFSDSAHQTAENIEEVETLFISTYAPALTENDRKKKASPPNSICIINLWYKTNETRWKIKKDEMKIFDDVLVYEKESDSYSVANLRAIR